jgi:hypothetical protein
MRVFQNDFSFECIEYPRVVRVEKGSRTIGLNYQSSAFPFKLVPRKNWSSTRPCQHSFRQRKDEKILGNRI